MRSAGNTYLDLNSAASQRASATSLKCGEKLSASGSVGETGKQQSGLLGLQSVNGVGTANSNSKLGRGFWSLLSSNPRLKKGLAHASLVLLLCFYTAAGASVIRLDSLVFTTHITEHISRLA